MLTATIVPTCWALTAFGSTKTSFTSCQRRRSWAHRSPPTSPLMVQAAAWLLTSPAPTWGRLAVGPGLRACLFSLLIWAGTSSAPTLSVATHSWLLLDGLLPAPVTTWAPVIGVIISIL